jgi:hypothetical protein
MVFDPTATAFPFIPVVVVVARVNAAALQVVIVLVLEHTLLHGLLTFAAAQTLCSRLPRAAKLTKPFSITQIFDFLFNKTNHLPKPPPSRHQPVCY